MAAMCKSGKALAGAGAIVFLARPEVSGCARDLLALAVRHPCMAPAMHREVSGTGLAGENLHRPKRRAAWRRGGSVSSAAEPPRVHANHVTRGRKPRRARQRCAGRFHVRALIKNTLTIRHASRQSAPISAIRVGDRHLTELGKIAGLAECIARERLLMTDITF
jgi:hypothetical protein